MRLLILISLLTSTIAFGEIVCRDGKCTEISVVNMPEGSALLGASEEQKARVAPVKLTDGDKLPNRPYQNTYDMLKWNQISVGKCLIDQKRGLFYKITKVDPKKQMFTYVIEKNQSEYSLAVHTTFWKLDESYAFKQLQEWDCSRTPNLHNDKYVKECVGDNQERKLLCSPPPRF